MQPRQNRNKHLDLPLLWMIHDVSLADIWLELRILYEILTLENMLRLPAQLSMVPVGQMRCKDVKRLLIEITMSNQSIHNASF
jgi:hypothetical protein